MPPKKRRVAAKVREQRRRDARVAAEPIIELEGEHEEPSEAEDRELESYDENNARIDAEVDALRVKYGIHDDECSWPSTRMLDVEENTEKLTRSELLDAVIARSDAVMARSEELICAKRSAICYAMPRGASPLVRVSGLWDALVAA